MGTGRRTSTFNQATPLLSHSWRIDRNEDEMVRKEALVGRILSGSYQRSVDAETIVTFNWAVARSRPVRLLVKSSLECDSPGKANLFAVSLTFVCLEYKDTRCG
jgi:hypothetical protein